MKRIISMFLCTLMVALMIVPAFATTFEEWEANIPNFIDVCPSNGWEEAIDSFNLSYIFENYVPHSKEEIAAFKAKFSRWDIEDLMGPGYFAHVELMSNNPILYSGKKNGGFAKFDSIMGIKTNNGLVVFTRAYSVNYYPYPPSFTYYTGSADEVTQYCEIMFTKEACALLMQLSEEERENVILEFYMTALETDEAVGLGCEPICYDDVVVPPQEEVKSKLDLSDVIENYTVHSKEEKDAFKAKLSYDELLSLLAPDLSVEVYIASNNPTLYFSRKDGFTFNNYESVMGIKKDNGVVEYVTTYSKDTFEQDGLAEISVFENDAASAQQYCKISLSRTALTLLWEMSAEEREAALLDFYMSILDTDEAVGLAATRIYWTGIRGDVNGDGKVNALDNIALINYITGRSTDIEVRNCDVNGDGKINARDNLYIKNIIIGA